MLIKVEQKHIETGKKGNPNTCPIALALQDAGLECPSVLYTHAYFNKYPAERKIMLPQEARLFIMLFDEGDPVNPFEFEAEEC